MAKWYSDGELLDREAMCEECESRDCAYNFTGICHLPLVFGVPANVTEEDGCLNFIVDF